MMTRELTSVSRRKFVAGVGATGALALAGCTQGESGSEKLSGNIRVSGSSTVYPIATAVSELFREENSDVTFDISRDGSSGGFENVFIPGDSDINNASRPITEEEVQRCQDNGFEAVEFQVAQDALTIVVNNENNFLESITYDELEQ